MNSANQSMNQSITFFFIFHKFTSSPKTESVEDPTMQDPSFNQVINQPINQSICLFTI